VTVLVIGASPVNEALVRQALRGVRAFAKSDAASFTGNLRPDWLIAATPAARAGSLGLRIVPLQWPAVWLPGLVRGKCGLRVTVDVCPLCLCSVVGRFVTD
jgi:hypothetical protein